MTYQIWTARSLLAWSPALLVIAGGLAGIMHPAADWHQRLVGLFVSATTVYVVARRIELHQRFRASISHTLSTGTWVVNRAARELSDRELEALERGLHDALDRVRAIWPLAAVDLRGAWLHVQDEVYSHQGGRKMRVGGLTYPAGGMVLERKADVYALEDLACHEGVHALLYRLGVQAPTGVEHHLEYPELFAPVWR